jgi:hypothetical protein
LWRARAGEGGVWATASAATATTEMAAMDLRAFSTRFLR